MSPTVSNSPLTNYTPATLTIGGEEFQRIIRSGAATTGSTTILDTTVTAVSGSKVAADVAVKEAVLPTDAATATNQSTQITVLSAIRDKWAQDGLVQGYDVSTTGIWDNGSAQWVAWSGAVSQYAGLWPVQLQDGSANALTSSTSAPAGTERGLHVRQVGTVAATQSGTWNIGSITTLPALPANQSVNCAQMNGVAVTMGNGASGTGVQRVTIASDSTGQVIARGNVASDAVDSGNPVKIGFQARTSDITAVANGDRVDGVADKRGRQVVLVNALQENRFYASSSSDITNTTSTAVLAAGGAGVIYVVTAITVSNMSATVSTRVDILDGTTVIWRGPAASGGGGYSITFPDGIVCTANTALNAQCATTGAAVRVSISGHNIR